jgi:hypothetical protein
MTRLAVIAAVVVPALAASAYGSSNASVAVTTSHVSGLSGTYRTNVSTIALGGALNGIWKLQLQNRVYTFTYTGKTSKNV